MAIGIHRHAGHFAQSAREYQSGANRRRWFLNSSQLDAGAADEQASCNRVTGERNRLLFDERLALAVARKERAAESLDSVAGLKLAVLLISLDACAALSDPGDPLLIEVARRLGKATRGSEPVVRVDDGQFVLLMEDVTSAVDAERLATRLLDALMRRSRAKATTCTCPRQWASRCIRITAMLILCWRMRARRYTSPDLRAGRVMRCLRRARWHPEPSFIPIQRVRQHQATLISRRRPIA